MCDPCKGALDLFAYSSPPRFSVCVQDHISCRLALALATRPLSPLLPFTMSGTFAGEFVFLFCGLFFLSLSLSEWPRLNVFGAAPTRRFAEYVCWMCRESWTGRDAEGNRLPLSALCKSSPARWLPIRRKESLSRLNVHAAPAVQHLVVALCCSDSIAHAHAHSNSNAVL